MSHVIGLSCEEKGMCVQNWPHRSGDVSVQRCTGVYKSVILYGWKYWRFNGCTEVYRGVQGCNTVWLEILAVQLYGQFHLQTDKYWWNKKLAAWKTDYDVIITIKHLPARGRAKPVGASLKDPYLLDAASCQSCRYHTSSQTPVGYTWPSYDQTVMFIYTWWRLFFHIHSLQTRLHGVVEVPDTKRYSCLPGKHTCKTVNESKCCVEDIGSTDKLTTYRAKYICNAYTPEQRAQIDLQGC